jgi:hydrogenase maturation protease
MILIIGYGNPLRSDDALGQEVTRILQQRLKGSNVQMQMAYQLTPELAASISHARLVVFIDARIGGKPGEIICEAVERQPNAGAFTHNVTPESLLSAAHALYGALPVGVLISIVGAEFDYGSELSPQLQEMLPSIADEVQAIIESSVRVHIYGENDHA